VSLRHPEKKKWDNTQAKKTSLEPLLPECNKRHTWLKFFVVGGGFRRDYWRIWEKEEQKEQQVQRENVQKGGAEYQDLSNLTGRQA